MVASTGVACLSMSMIAIAITAGLALVQLGHAEEIFSGNRELHPLAQPAILNDVGIDQKLGDQIPLDLIFQDETGKQVAAWRLLRQKAAHSDARLLQVPNALHDGS